MLQYSVGILTSPSTAWRRLAELSEHSRAILLLYPAIWAALPAFAWFYGTTQIGWTVGLNDDVVRLTEESAVVISFLFYAAMVGAVVAIGYFIHWMADTYGAESTLTKGIMIASITATPLFLMGLVGFYPILWLDMLLGVLALSWSVYLLYLGIPIVMQIPQERGFLFASAVIAIALVVLITLMVVSVLAWDWGAAPAFTN
ncbi:amino acid transporter protein [Luminiphilus syltensis NOR5-1B]|uniref:Amino acid transporter protein n=1 Tax=Luminiphilus syltensis NOR5-1B TaxID=565045 RepID=B8KR21_9GAMM|nr:Yip1 family protein [Luminiphilus syltensis]EED34583.1 amino acid transporter protein [Luminiphilus syltensis NOR5-1B]